MPIRNASGKYIFSSLLFGDGLTPVPETEADTEQECISKTRIFLNGKMLDKLKNSCVLQNQLSIVWQRANTHTTTIDASGEIQREAILLGLGELEQWGSELLYASRDEWYRIKDWVKFESKLNN